MNTVTETITEPRAWIGCLACYNNGRLVGEWLDTDELEDLDTSTICPIFNHEEFWVMDHEGLPISGECSISEAYRYGVAVKLVAEQAEERDIPLVVAMEYVEGLNLTNPEDWPNVADDYQGMSEGEQDYVEEFLENCGITLPSWVHVNYRDSFEELTMDCATIRSGGDLYVFNA